MKCGALVSIVAYGYSISVWIILMLSKINRSMPSVSNGEKKTTGEVLLV